MTLQCCKSVCAVCFERERGREREGGRERGREEREIKKDDA